jgi:hypothetical protein
VAERVASVVYLDAFVPEHGERGFDLTSEFSRQGLRAAIERGEPSRPAPTAETFGVNPADRAWVNSKLMPQPVGVAM